MGVNEKTFMAIYQARQKAKWDKANYDSRHYAMGEVLRDIEYLLAAGMLEHRSGPAAARALWDRVKVALNTKPLAEWEHLVKGLKDES